MLNEHWQWFLKLPYDVKYNIVRQYLKDNPDARITINAGLDYEENIRINRIKSNIRTTRHIDKPWKLGAK